MSNSNALVIEARLWGTISPISSRACLSMNFRLRRDEHALSGQCAKQLPVTIHSSILLSTILILQLIELFTAYSILLYTLRFALTSTYYTYLLSSMFLFLFSLLNIDCIVSWIDLWFIKWLIPSFAKVCLHTLYVYTPS